MRTHYCGELNSSHHKQEVVICGWVHSSRDHGGVLFIDLRDYKGIVQVISKPDSASFEVANSLRSEYIIQVHATVYKRPDGNDNPNLGSGEVELIANKILMLNKAETPAFSIDDTKVSEKTRLKHRVLDLRSQNMQHNLRLRAKTYNAFRSYLIEHGFCEVETPMLTKSTPEGARDFIIPSRINEHKFFALPQSPQLFKQLLMGAGFDRYYQIIKCFRDEDLRSDRQPEFTQVDLELSFTDRTEVMNLMESCIKYVFQDVIGVEYTEAFPQISYKEAMERYGSDKPDLRIDLEITELTNIFKNSNLKVFREIANSNKGYVGCINAKSAADRITRKNINDLNDYVISLGAKGLAWIRVDSIEANISAGLTSTITKNMSDEELKAIIKYSYAKPGDIIFFAANKKLIALEILGELRTKLGNEYGYKNTKLPWCPLWVIDFPLFLNSNGLKSIHHPFTSPKNIEDLEQEENYDQILSLAYDLVLNGNEIGGGSIRIHNKEVQEKIFKILGLDNNDIEEQFGFFMHGLASGCPPHGGMAFGLDRIVALMCNASSIREVIAFPKTQTGQCLLTSAPSKMPEDQLIELGIKLR